MKTVRLGQEVKRFKFAVLMYSLKMKYDIKFYNSSANRLAVWCTKHEKKMWLESVLFFRKRQEQADGESVTHICVRSGYTKLLKWNNSTII